MPWRCTNGRTSTTPPSRAAGQRAADLEHRIETLGLEEVEAAKDLLGIRKRAVRDQRFAAFDSHRARCLSRMQLSTPDVTRELRDLEILASHLLQLRSAHRLIGTWLLIDQYRELHTPSLKIVINRTTNRHRRRGQNFRGYACRSGEMRVRPGNAGLGLVVVRRPETSLVKAWRGHARAVAALLSEAVATGRATRSLSSARAGSATGDRVAVGWREAPGPHDLAD